MTGSKPCPPACSCARHPSITEAERFWSHVDKSGGGGSCWSWLKGLSERGYGMFMTCSRRSVRAHRFSYELEYGTIPAGMYVLHSCDNRRCVNPRHLTVGDQAENMAQASARHRANNSRGAVSIDVIRAVRRAEGAHREIAQRFSISPASVSRIRNRVVWADVE